MFISVTKKNIIIYCSYKMISNYIVEEAAVFILPKNIIYKYRYYLSTVISLGRICISKLKYPTWKMIFKQNINELHSHSW